MKKARRLAVIVPVHNETISIRPFYEKTKAVLEKMIELESWSVVFCNNGSDDDSLAEIMKLRDTDQRVKVITLSKNFGYHGALIAGLSTIEADLYAIIDVDCEDPPDLLPAFLSQIEGGAELVYGIRSKRSESVFITFFRKVFYALNRKLADSEIVMWMAEFSMMTRQVRDAVLLPRTTFPFLRAEMGYVGFHRVGIPYARGKRLHGRSHYNLWSMTKFAIAGILSSTTFPLRLTFYCACVLAVCYPLIVWLFEISAERAAWLASIFSLYFLLVTLPFIALYLARTYRNGIYRPVFIVDWHRTHL